MKCTHWQVDPDVAVTKPVGGSGNIIVLGDQINNETGTENKARVGEPSETPSENPMANLLDVENINDNMPEPINQEEDESNDEAEDDESDSSDSDDKDNMERPQRSAKIMAGVKQSVQFR